MILGVDGILSLRLTTDCSVVEKTMTFICDLLGKVIDELGPGNIFSVVMDGVCKVFPLHENQVSPCVVFHIHTNLVRRESLDDTLHHLLPWDIDLIIDDPVDEPEEEPEV